MSVTITPTNWTIRAGPEHTKYGEPYELVATVLSPHPEEAWIIGACCALSMRDATEIEQRLRGMGFRVVRWQRVRDGEMRVRRRRLNDLPSV